MSSGIIFAFLAAGAFGLWTVFHQQAANHINSLFGAIIVSLTAFLMGGVILFLNRGENAFSTNAKGIVFAVLAGVCALGIDYFVLRAYSSGLQISTGGPIIIAGGILVAVFIGLFFGDSVSILKLLGIILVLLGAGILASLTS